MTTERLLLVGLVLLPALGAAVWALRRGRRRGAGEAGDPAIAGAPAAMAPRPAAPGQATRDAATQTDAHEVLHRLYAVAFDGAAAGDGSTSAPTGHAEVSASAAALLGRIETQPRYAPRRPQLLPQLVGAVNDPDASVRSIARIIAQDPALAGNLLRITNSAMYRVQSRPIESIERAVTVLGTEGIRMIIAAALVQPVMSTGGGVFGRFPAIVWEHTLVAASAAADHAKLLEGEDPFTAQLVGLLHGLGAIIVVQVLRDEYARRPALVPDAGVAIALLDAWSGPTASRLAAQWELTGRIRVALEDQRPQARPDALTPLGRSLRFGRVAGALAMLRSKGDVGEDEAVATLAQVESREAGWASTWARISAAG